jgi:iron complex outermembrane receptor protein
MSLDQLRKKVLAVVLLSGLLPLASAHTRADKLNFDIAAGSASLTLKEFILQTRLQVLFESEDVRNRETHSVTGAYNPSEALTVMLAETGLVFDFVNDTTVVITSEKKKLDAQAMQIRRAELYEVEEAATDTAVQYPATVNSDAASDETARNSLEEIVVTGSRLSHSANESAQDIRIYSREEIDRSGQTAVAEFLNTLPSISVANTVGGFQHNFGATTVQLRGLPVGTTLVLLNGRRVQTSGNQSRENFFDLNNIPLAAVDRIEVVANGASAIYGSDAIAGVVNVILKSNFSGFDINTKYGGAAHTNESLSSLAWGQRWERGHLSFIGSFQRRTELLGSERTLTASNDYTSYGGADNNVSVCNPGNVFFPNGYSFNGQAPVKYAAVPKNPSQTPNVQDFSHTAGALNECALASSTLSLIPDTRHASALLNGEFTLTKSITLFAEVLYTHTRQTANAGGLASLYGTPDFQQYVVPASNPYNPFGQDVGIGYAFTGYPFADVSTTEFVRPVIGARGAIAEDWDWEVTALQSQDFTNDTEPNTIPNSAAIQAALSSSDPAMALNPFVSGPPGSRVLVQSLFSDARFKYSSRSRVISGSIRGTLFRLPAGHVELAVGGEHDQDRLYANSVNNGIDPPNTRSTNTRRTAAVFTEARVPILAGRSGGSAGRVTVSIAARYDDYSDFGSTTNPQFGVEWHATDTLFARGTYSRGFKAPSLYTLYQPQQVYPENLVLDPRSGQQVVVPVRNGGNLTLRPERGRSDTLGLEYTSKMIANLHASVTHWRVRETSTIQSVDPQFFLNNEGLFPDRVTRDPSGAITLINDTFVNFGSVDVAGLDYQVDYQRRTGIGALSGAIALTQTYRYDVRLLPGAPAIDRVSVADTGGWAPRWKGALGLGWKLGALGANLNSHYVSRYKDYGGTRDIGNFWIHDVNVHYEFGRSSEWAHGWAKGGTLELGCINLFNRTPQFSNIYFGILGYDPTQADIRGRYGYFQVGIRL